MGVPHGRVGRALVFGLGAILLLASALASLPVALVAAGALVLAASGDPPRADDLDAEAVLFLGISMAVAVLCWMVGVRLVRGRRRLVLFLRRFGFTPATNALTYAVGGGIGKRWRLVTLDDDRVAPVGVAGGSRWLVRVLRLVAVVVLAVALWSAISWLRGDPAGEVADEVFQSSVDQAEDEGQDPISALVGAIFAAAIVTAVVLVIGLLVVLVPIAVAGTSAAFLSVGSRSVQRAERAKAIVIARPGAVDRSAARIWKKTRKVFAPRMIVARVANPLWQDVVRRLAAVADAVIVDVSEPSDNVVWEVEQLAAARARWIPIGRLDRLGELQVGASPAAGELRALLGERDVLAYRPDRLETFASALNVALEARRDRDR